MIVHPKRTSTYVFTVDNTAIGKAEIAKLANEVKIFNAREKLRALENPTYKPKVRKISKYGRLGKNNPQAELYKRRNRNSWRNAYARILLEDAATIDVYVTTYEKKVVPHWSGVGTTTYLSAIYERYSH